MNIYESSENYLEAILSLKERHGMVRSIDIANELHFSKPSVSVAMKKLRESGYMLPQSANTHALLEELISNPPTKEFPLDAAKELLRRIPCNETGKNKKIVEERKEETICFLLCFSLFQNIFS